MKYDEDLQTTAFGFLQKYIDNESTYQNEILFLVILGSCLIGIGILGIIAWTVGHKMTVIVVRYFMHVFAK